MSPRSFFMFLSAISLLSTPASALEMTSRQVEIGPKLTMAHAQKAAAELFKLDATGSEPILLMIGVRTGYAPATMVLVDAIQSLQQARVYGVVHSEAIGAGAIIAAFCHRRFAFPHASFMVNKLEYDSEKAMTEEPPLPVAAATRVLDRAYATVAKRLGMKTADFKSKAEAGWYMSAEDAKKAKIVDEIVTKVTWIDLVQETTEIKKTNVFKLKKSTK